MVVNAFLLFNHINLQIRTETVYWFFSEMLLLVLMMQKIVWSMEYKASLCHICVFICAYLRYNKIQVYNVCLFVLNVFNSKVQFLKALIWVHTINKVQKIINYKSLYIISNSSTLSLFVYWHSVYISFWSDYKKYKQFSIFTRSEYIHVHIKFILCLRFTSVIINMLEDVQCRIKIW